MSTREKRRDVLLFDLLMMIDPNFETQYIIQICNPEEDWESFQSFRNSSRLLEPFYDMRIEGIDAISEGVFRIMFCEEDWAKIRGFSALPCKVGDRVYDIKRTDFDWMNDILKSMKRWKDFIAGESEYTLSAMLMNTAGSLSKLVGIPIGSAARDLKAMGNLIVYHIIGEDELSYRYRKESKEIGSEKNLGDYVERMLRARLTGNDKLATEIYNDMIRAGISNKKIDDRMDSKERKRLKEEPAAAEGAEAYRRGDYAGYTAALDTLLKKGYGRKNAISVMESIYQKKGVEDAEGEETFTTITDGYWDEGEEEPVGYEMLYNAYMNGSKEDYAEMQQRLLEQGKEDKNIRQSMRSRLKDAYKEASEAGDYEKAQKARSEFLRLGGKPETLLKP